MVSIYKADCIKVVMKVIDKQDFVGFGKQKTDSLIIARSLTSTSTDTILLLGSSG